MFKMLQNVLKCVLFTLFVLGIAANGMADDALKSKDMNTAAEAGLSYFLNLIPENDLTAYGFNSTDEFKVAQLGAPYEMFIFTDQFLNDATTSADQAMKSVEEMRFPVMVNGEYRALLTVGKKDNLWQAVGFGAALLAKELQSKENTIGTRSNASKVILRYLQGKCDFVMMKESTRALGTTPLYPVNPNSGFLMSVDSSYRETYTLDDLRTFIHK